MKFKLLILFFVLQAFFIVPTYAETINIIHTSDVHGNIDSEVRNASASNEQSINGGYALLKDLINKVKAEGDEKGELTLCLDSGDYFLGTPVVDQTSGECMIDLMSYCGYHAVTLGNHEFDYSSERLFRLFEESDIIPVCCNIFSKNKDTQPDPIKPYDIVSFKTIKIGITGLETPCAIATNFEQNLHDLEIKAPKECLLKTTQELRKLGCDYIILLSHLGIDDDRQLASTSPGIDLILGGHSHFAMPETEFDGPERIPVIHSGAYLKTASKVKIIIEKNKKPVLERELKTLSSHEFSEDPDTKKLVAKFMKREKATMGRSIGSSQVSLFRGVIGGDSPEGSYTTDAIREAVKADFAFLNAGSIRNPIKAGQLTLESLFLVFPFNNTIVVLEMTGEKIYELIEKTLSVKFRPQNEHDLFAGRTFGIEFQGLVRDYYDRYGYLVPSNLIYHFDPELPTGKRILKLTDLKGCPIDLKKTYRVAFSSFITAGGDGFDFLKNEKSAKDSGVLLRDALEKKLEREKEIKEIPEQRVFNEKLTVRELKKNAQ
ncbi:MAG: bifunctional metallophosphatase/5'-nucleotidase [Candidatus Riflebacteria bacterium]|nr:bifunctional metallophosphatase/5'-nucleotidase [Candidatus Riflebacteria bacterium]